MKYLLLIVTICFATGCGRQPSLDIRVVYEKESSRQLNKEDFKVDPHHIYEDDDFVVGKDCHGEFGGRIIFKDKKTGKQYATKATCPIAINKLHGSYFVTTTLAHMVGFSAVLEIKDPRQLAPAVEGDLARRPDDSWQLQKGVKVIADTFNVLAITSFVYNEQLYHILREYNTGIYVARIENGVFVKVAMISTDDLCEYDPEVCYTDDKHAIVCYSNDELRGYYDIYENHIKVVRYQ